MSARKVLSSGNKNQYKTSSSIIITPRSGPTQSHPNSSRMLGGLASHSNNLSQLNSSVCSIKSNLPPYIPQDTDFEADVTYSEYLQALAMKSIASKLLSKDKMNWDIDLCTTNKELISKETELMNLEHENQIKEMQLHCDKLFLNLKSVLDKWLYNMESNNMLDKLDNIIKALNGTCNKLELENISALTSTGYMKLKQCIEMYAQILISVKLDNEDSIALNNLAKQLTTCIGFCNDIEQDAENLKSVTRDYVHLLYKTLSDSFADENKSRQPYSF